MPHVHITPDDLEARLVLEADEALNEYQALIYIARKGVRHGLLHEAIGAVADLTGPAEVLVAIAVQPEGGEDARIDTPLGNTAFPFRVRWDAAGRVLFPELPMPSVVQPGDVVAVKTPAVPPRPGRTVTGKPLGPEPAPVCDIVLKAGLGTEMALDGLRVVAAVEGNPCCIDGTVTVRPELKVAGDLVTGDDDVRFGGNVMVAGDVKGQIEILAAGDVTVLGDVEGAKVAAGGRVVVHGSVRKQATIVASTDVLARAIEFATVRCGATLAVRDDVVVATIEGAKEVLIGGAVEGGTINATQRVEARTVGGAGGTATRVYVMPPLAKGPEPAAPPEVGVREVMHPGVEVRIARGMAKFSSTQPAGVFREAAGSVVHAPWA